jgi:dCMP deaminase
MEIMKPELIEAYKTTTEAFAKLSRARRLQVGAIVVKDGRIISIGYNGTPAGWDNNCEDVQEDGSLKTKPEVVHAEMNAIGKLAKSNESGDGSTMFITHAPCVECAKLIAVSGIKKVYFGAAYRSDDGVVFLQRCGVEVDMIPK